MSGDFQDATGNTRRGSDDTFTSPVVGSQLDQRLGGVNQYDSPTTAFIKVQNYQETQQLAARYGPTASLSVPAWLKWLVLCGLVAGVLALAAAVLLGATSDGVLARTRLLRWAAGDSLGQLMSTQGGWAAVVGQRRAPTTPSEPMEIVLALQNNFLGGGGRIEETQRLGAAAWHCLALDSSACLSAVEAHSDELRRRGLAVAARARMPAPTHMEPVPQLLGAAAGFVEFEIIKSRGPLRGDIDVDRASVFLLGLCLRRTVYDRELQPADCAAAARTQLRLAGEPPSPLTRERLAVLDGWRWSVASIAYRWAQTGNGAR